jgi:hypothetical protein
VVRIEGTLDEMGEECALVLIDVTQEKKQLEGWNLSLALSRSEQNPEL